MVNLFVDEAYAFDYLSILEIKKNINKENTKAWSFCYDYLMKQFEYHRWMVMINSEEYKNMVKANFLTFDAVDKAKNNLVTAQYVDQCNYQRYIAKKDFQSKFFNNNLNENKIGYEKYENSNLNSR